jgi:hypothetical protein
MTPDERAAAFIKRHDITAVETDGEYTWGRVDDLREWLAAEIRDAIDECAKALCIYCAEGWPLKGEEHHAPDAGHILLPGGRCHAIAFRAAACPTSAPTP